MARIVDLSVTGARIDGLTAPEGSVLQLTYRDPKTSTRTRRRAAVKRSAQSEAGPWVGIAFLEEPAAAPRAA
jgi:hypothetical protein